MAATSSNHSQAPRSTTSPAPAGPASARLEKSHPGVRRSTPDSEVLASSDDDVDHPQLAPVSTAPAPKPARRTSWLNEVPPSVNRKASLPAGNPLSSGPSNPTSPVTDQSAWGANTSPGIGGSIPWSNVGSGSFPWGTGIWNTESRREPPPRLSELVPSPTMSHAAPGPLGEEILSPTARTMSGDSSIPFSIPLRPTPKTYRSQSYSVGQLDPEYLGLMANKSSVPHSAGRTRNSGQLTSLQHRSSRPSLLGELGHDPAMLGRVREDEDDDEGSPTGSDRGVGNSTDQARTIEQLSRENALLRQAAGQVDNRPRDRAASTASANSGYAIGNSVHGLNRIRGSVPEETDLAVEDQDELRDIPGYNNIRSNARRRLSEQSTNLEQQFPTFASLENRNLDNVRKAHWQTTLGFGSVADVPQSRRHSFADVPMRHASVSSLGESSTAINPRAGLGDRDDGYANIGENALSNAQGQNQSYLAREQSLRDGPSGMPSSLQQSYALSNSYGRQQPALAPHHQNQLLYVVTFKCHRADVFYIQEDTGLQVNPGDLVIVEADRGTDLGTVQHANVSLQRARELKQHFAEEHYKWLMMFSRQGQNGTSNVVNATGGVSGLGGRSAIGGMGPHGPHGPHGAQDSSADIKPKLIKRLAQNHEILTLRDKEGNEAKAKRVCQQKVAEHRLNMEILDAEFQMDWKKLTFYYFADSYINFNSLVTDLFKIYKTRIWMSAINPASFVTSPSAGLQSNPLGYGQETQTDRRQPENRYGSPRDGSDTGRGAIPNQMGLLRSVYSDPYQSFGQDTRQPDAGLGGFPSGLQSQVDPFASYVPGYGSLESGYVDYGSNNAGAGRIHPASGDWANRFQGLSLNS